MNIRQLKEADYTQFLKLINDFRETYFTQEQFIYTLKYIQESHSEIWVVEKDNELIATATIIYETKFIFNICKSAHIEDVCTKKEYRNQGYGKQLINHLIHQGHENNCYKINLVCSKDVSPFYQSANFEERGIHMSQLI